MVSVRRGLNGQAGPLLTPAPTGGAGSPAAFSPAARAAPEPEEGPDGATAHGQCAQDCRQRGQTAARGGGRTGCAGDMGCRGGAVGPCDRRCRGCGPPRCHSRCRGGAVGPCDRRCRGCGPRSRAVRARGRLGRLLNGGCRGRAHATGGCRRAHSTRSDSDRMQDTVLPGIEHAPPLYGAYRGRPVALHGGHSGGEADERDRRRSGAVEDERWRGSSRVDRHRAGRRDTGVRDRQRYGFSTALRRHGRLRRPLDTRHAHQAEAVGDVGADRRRGPEDDAWHCLADHCRIRGVRLDQCRHRGGAVGGRRTRELQRALYRGRRGRTGPGRCDRSGGRDHHRTCRRAPQQVRRRGCLRNALSRFAEPA
ncbi:hypothetical protein SNL152K_4607 [Streptomyces sp. NL15-2K]|nr:hypothetical protein SNL152K_4607 [Streptomyces sp. NL15-2K]